LIGRRGNRRTRPRAVRQCRLNSAVRIRPNCVTGKAIGRSRERTPGLIPRGFSKPDMRLKGAYDRLGRIPVIPHARGNGRGAQIAVMRLRLAEQVRSTRSAVQDPSKEGLGRATFGPSPTMGRNKNTLIGASLNLGRFAVRCSLGSLLEPTLLQHTDGCIAIGFISPGAALLG
jgi:hypothetical protein